MKFRKAHLSSTGLFVRGILILFLGLQVRGTAKTVDWQGPSGSKIKGIRYFPKETPQEEPSAAPLKSTATTAAPAILSNVIDSPPTDGFVPWIVLTATDASEDAESTGVYEATPLEFYFGNPPAGTDPRTDYFIGLYDTGASAHVIGYENAVRAGLYNATPSLLTGNIIPVSGVTGSVDTKVTQAYSLFMDGLDALEPNGLEEAEMVLPTTSGMVGEYNVSTLVGLNPGSKPDLATAIGAPMSVFYAAHIEVDKMVTVTHNGTEYTAPTISFHDPNLNEPNYPNYVPLELKPLGATNVQYITYGFDMEDFLANFPNIELDYSPVSPSIVIGTGSQSLFFIHGVDMAEGSQKVQDESRFMLDTGAQVTVIGDRIAARLKLHPDNKDFEVDIEGVDGKSKTFPGFYIDSLTIPAVGDWLEFTNVPVVWLEISSPEGGKLDGIVGMNLFTQYNLILRAGGFMLQDDPRLEFERIQTGPVTGDIAPEIRDGKVDLVDFSVFSRTWMAADTDGNWNADADFVPSGSSEGIIDLEDLSVLAQNWLAGTSL
ncbi:MAG: aspartyl protease family protein [Phycisphaerae bacterium]|nr:aspartyl protease family protein [Phycisphaerae bacterium]